MGGSEAQSTLADTIRKDLYDRGVTQAQLAEELGVSVPTIARVLRGDYPGRFVAHKVATHYGFKPSDVWPIQPEGNGNDKPKEKAA